jgi:4-amino-4-deoxy-L-arabinose transferase-like glycosyltransferase
LANDAFLQSLFGSSAKPLMRSISFPRAVLLISVLALIARASVLVANLPDPEQAVLGSDTDQYLQVATTLFSDGRYGITTSSGFSPEIIRTPGYPVFLALFMPFWGIRPLAAVMVTQVVLGALTTTGLMILANRLFDTRIGLIAGLIYALAPMSIVVTGFAYTETLFTALLVGGCLLLIEGQDRDKWLLSLLSGLAFGLATLTRSVGLFISPLLVVIPLLRGTLKQTWRHALIMTIAFMLPVGGWMARNNFYYDRYNLTVISDLNLYYYNAASLEAHRNDISIAEARERLNERLANTPADGTRWPASREGTVAREVIFAHPLAFAWYNGVDALNGLRPGFSFMLKLVNHTEDDADPIRVFMGGDLAAMLDTLRSQAAIIALIELYMLLFVAGLVIGACAGAFILLIRRRWAEVVLLGLIPAVLLYLPGIASNARFRVPTEPLLAVLVAMALVEIARLYTQWKSARGSDRQLAPIRDQLD